MYSISFELGSFKKKKAPQIESRNELKDIVNDLNSGNVNEIHSMPAMKDAYNVTRVPSPVSIVDKDNIDLDYVSQNAQISINTAFISNLSSSVRTWKIHQ